MKHSKVEICFIGNAIVDILSKISNETLNKLEIPKGSMQLVDEESSDKILKYIKDPSIISGGSAANTAVGFKSFGGTCSFIGQIGNDKFGDLFSNDLNQYGIFFKSKNSKCEGFVGTDNEIPYKSAPSIFIHRDSQEPLNPVWPVIKTFLFEKILFIIINLNF